MGDRLAQCAQVKKVAQPAARALLRNERRTSGGKDTWLNGSAWQWSAPAAYPCLEPPAAAALVRQPAQTRDRISFDFGACALAFYLAVDKQLCSNGGDVGGTDLIHAEVGPDNLASAKEERGGGGGGNDYGCGGGGGGDGGDDDHGGSGGDVRVVQATAFTARAGKRVSQAT